MNFRDLCNSINNTACVISVRKTATGYDEIRIVDGNDKYLASFKTEDDYYNTNQFIPNSIYTKYLEKNLNFEDYCYRSAVKKELLHSYAYPEHYKAWFHMLFIPLEYETNELSYCLYIMEINDVFNPENLANSTGEFDNNVLKSTLQMANTKDFKSSLKSVTREIRKLCNAAFCCILLVDELKEEFDVAAEDRDLNSDRLTMNEYIDNDFYDLVKSWDDTIGNSNCIIIDDEMKMDYVKNKNPKWYESLTKNGIDSLVLFRLKSGNDQIGYMWVSNFKADDSTKIKELLEMTTFILGYEIGNKLLVDKLTTLSSIDVLTGLYNRNKMNSYMIEMNELRDPIGVVFLDINGLKQVNDIEGHLAGDNLIKRASKLLKKVFKGSYIFRAGGDEFVVIIKDACKEEIENKLGILKKESKKYNVSFAYGYSITDDSKEIDKILKEADANMYNNKREFYNSLK
jgi:diguanylate cyclase (GGDEF)-like protein